MSSVSGSAPNHPPALAWWPAALAGLLAMLAVVGLQEALNAVSQQFVSAPSAAAQTIVRLTPGAITNLMIETLGKGAIQLLTASAYVGTVLIGGALGVLGLVLRRRGAGWPAIVTALAGPTFVLYLLVAPAQTRGLESLLLTAVVGLVLSLLFAGLTLVLWRAVQPAAFVAGGAVDPRRRAFLGGGLAAVLLLVGAGILGRNAVQAQAESPQALVPLEPVGTVAPAAAATAVPPTAVPAPPTVPAAAAQSTVAPATAAPAAAPTAPPAPTATAAPSAEQVEERYFAAIKGLGPELTPIGKFYVVDEAIDDPRIDPQSWRLTIKGHVEKPVTLTFDQVRAMPFVDQFATLLCISYELGQDLISNGKWRGVRLSELLKLAGVKPGATEVILRSVDKYAESHAMERALQPETILAYGMNDVLLPRQHGAPLRAIVPGLYGFKHVKWLTEVEVISGQSYQGYWQESAGWTQTGALASAMSRIDTVDSPPVKVGGKATVAGIAFASLRGISKIEVSDDGGKTWQPGRVKRPLSPMSWSFWAYEWSPKQAGKAKLLVRAYEKDGTPQVATVQPAHPNGATGYHGFDYDVVP